MATYESKKYGTIPVAATQIADGSVTNAEYQFINSLSSNAQTQITALDAAKLNLAGGISALIPLNVLGMISSSFLSRSTSIDLILSKYNSKIFI